MTTAMPPASQVTPKGLEIWFCGPLGLIRIISDGTSVGGLRYRFHQEAFGLR